MKKLLSVPILLVMALVASACSTYVETASPADVVCIVGAGGKHGNDLKRVIEPGSPPSAYKFDDISEESISIPGTQRFWNESFDDGNRDVGASTHIPMRVNRIRLRVPIQVDFTINAELACEFYLNHLSRPSYQPLNFSNEQEGVPSGWLNWLNQNMGRALDDTAEGGFVNANGYTPQGLIENYDMNANDLGQIPEGEEFAGVAMKEHLEEAWSELFNEEFISAIGAPYLCGLGYNPAEPDVCPPLTVSIVGDIQVHPDETSFLASFEEQKVSANNAITQQNITESERIAEAERVEQERIKIEADNEIEELRRTAAAEDEPNRVADLERRAEEARLQAEIDNADCIYIFEATGETCATQAAAENGTFYPGETPPVLVPQAIPTAEG